MSQKFKLHSEHKKILSDTLTPVSIYLKIRDLFPHSLLLESSDYDARTNNFSYICCNPIASLSIEEGKVKYTFPDGNAEEKIMTEKDHIPELVENFAKQFESKKYPFKFINNGLFGFIAHEAVAHFDHLTLNPEKINLNLPEIYYAVYQNIIAISLFNHEAHLFSHSYDQSDNLDQIEKIPL